MSESAPHASPVIGWREWVGLPELGVHRIKAKIDTGARSSALHAFDVKKFVRDGRIFVRFWVYPLQRDSKKKIQCEAEVLESRLIRSSTGHEEERTVIVTSIQILDRSWPIELTLANRDEMGFRMLLGREGIRRRFLIDAGRSFYGGQPRKKRKKK
jgi:hypothetical protein